jgi:hypothetical protein
MTDLSHFRSSGGYWYLATPYSKYPGGIEAAYREACKAAAWLIRNGVKVFCPIAHSHPIAIEGGIDPMDHTIWLPADEPLMDGATGLVVCMMESWEVSYGVRQEMFAFQRAEKPIRTLEWPQEDCQ